MSGTVRLNLAALFAQATKEMYRTVDGMNLVDMDVSIARLRLDALLATHGEALITALEYYADKERWGVTHTGNVHDIRVCLPNTGLAKELLATMEREAGGQP